jgi:hypothetical protein
VSSYIYIYIFFFFQLTRTLSFTTSSSADAQTSIEVGYWLLSLSLIVKAHCLHIIYSRTLSMGLITTMSSLPDSLPQPEVQAPSLPEQHPRYIPTGTTPDTTLCVTQYCEEQINSTAVKNKPV